MPAEGTNFQSIKNIRRLSLEQNPQKLTLICPSPHSLFEMDEKRPLRRQPEDHNFGSLLMLAVTAGAFLLVVWVATKALFLLLQESSIP
jgi:hypothetical protein